MTRQLSSNSRCDSGEMTHFFCKFLGGSSSSPIIIFSRLTINPVQNAYERDIVHAASVGVIDGCVSALQFARFISSLFLLSIGSRACITLYKYEIISVRDPCLAARQAAGVGLTAPNNATAIRMPAVA